MDLRRPLNRPPWALLCWTLLWWAPFAVSRHSMPITSFYSEALAVVLGGVATALTWWGAAGTVVAPGVRALRPVLAGWAGWALLVTGQALGPTAMAPAANLLCAAGMGAVLLVMLGGAGSRRWSWSASIEAWLAAALLVGGALTVAGQLLQLVGMDELYGPLLMTMAPGHDRRLFGNLGQANHAATYLVWGLAALMFLVQAHQERSKRWSPLLMGAALSGTVLLDVGLAFTGSRTPLGQVAVLAGLGLWSAWSRRNVVNGPVLLAQRWRRTWFPALLLPVLLLVSVAVAWANHRWQWGLSDPAQRLHDPAQMSPRMALWRGAWALFRAHPVFGSGWGDYAWNQYRTVLPLGPVEPVMSAHNLVLDLLARTGLVGAGLVLVPLVMWAWRAWRAPVTAPRTLALALVATLGVHAMVEFPETYLFFLLPVAFLMGRWAGQDAPLAAADRGARALPRVDRSDGGPRARGLALTAWLASAVTLVLMIGFHQAETALESARIPVLGVVKDPEVNGLGRVFAPWLDAFAWPRSLDRADQNQAARWPGFDPHMARSLALIPRVDNLRRMVLALARADRPDDAWDAAQRWRLLCEGYRQWPEERSRLLQAVDSAPRDPGLARLGRRVRTWPLPAPTTASVPASSAVVHR